MIRPARAETPEMAVAASAGPATVLVETGRKDRSGDPVLIEIPAPQHGRRHV